MNEPRIVDPVFGCSYRFWRTPGANGADIQHVDMEVVPGGGVSPHIHHRVEERFTVNAGRAEFLSGRRWIEAGPGESVVVAPGTRHAFRNRGTETANVVCEAEPASSLQEFLTEVAELSREGVFTRHGVPRGPRAMLKAAVLVEKHRGMVELLFPPLPPMPIQQWVMAPLARLGRRRGLGPA
ncbi:MAG: cupin domain-containing protein [Thermoleophilaceae bacterium]|nr:cupin domain-containing protein [Thermoleophilaceae bacterium]